MVVDWQHFGKKLMSKSGWQDGDGLGPERNGARESIAMQFKDDSRGLGCTLKYEQNWLAHNDHFNSLLASLNQEHGKEEDPSAGPEKVPERISLEEKSKTSRGRIQ